MDKTGSNNKDISLRDVAKLANVSVAAASLALREKAGSQATRKRVWRAAEQLGYVASSAARTLKSGKSSVIGIYIFSSPEGRDYANESSFFYRFFKSVADAARVQDHGVLIEDVAWNEPPRNNSLLRHIRGRNVDGAILVPQYDYPYYFIEELRRSGLSFCICNPAYVLGDFCSVSFDNRSAAELAIRELLSSPIEHLAVVNGPMNHVEAKARANGAEHALSNVDKATSLTTLYGDFSIESGYKAGNRLFSRLPYPDAVYAANDYMAVGVLRSALEHEIDVPAELRIVGTDDNEVSRAVTPQLTTIRNPIGDIGRAAAQCVFAQLTGETDSECTPARMIEPSLIRRGSS